MTDDYPAPIGHNNPPRQPTRAEVLYDHILALERLQDVKDDAAADYNARKQLVKEAGFDPNVVEAIKKRRKNGHGQTQAFDQILAEYEDMIEDVEATRRAEEEKDDQGIEQVDLQSLADRIAIDGVTVTVHVPDQEKEVNSGT